ncbi:putative F-box protein At5g51000 [Arabidopsis lyrata subsp. lyrata]|nr:putative F-box protein At5g51000 [Arabidopsis lyrata subsp. lyrata]|eukprot:XP_020871886.1 putative F-box protein At5g51000 [Arabidopsis lyrata subsp. lyrata]
MVVMMYHFEAYLMSINLHNHKDLVDPFIKKIGKLKHVKICEVFHCNGLLLCVTHEYKLVVWNPYSGQTRWIQPRNDDISGPVIYCVGYDINNNHKILRLSYWIDNYVCEIYDFKCNSWRVLDITMEWYIRGQGVSFQKNSYFIAQGMRKVEEVTSKGCLLCFDFTRERFLGLSLPCHCRIEDSVILSVVREEKLAVLYRRRDALEIEIWITNKIEPNEVLWSHFLKLDMVRFHYLNGSFFVDEKKKVAVICDVDYTTRANYKACMVGEGGHYREWISENLSVSHICALMFQVRCRSSNVPILTRRQDSLVLLYSLH